MEDFVFYFISGLGADERAFQFLKIHSNNIFHLNWIKPVDNEPLSDYCDRIINKIDFDFKKKIVLIGVSFGGIVAQELAMKVNCHKVFIISSIKSCNELSIPFKIIQRVKLHRLVPSQLYKYLNNYFVDYLANYFFSVENKLESQLLKEIIQATDPYFLKWAIDQIFCWKSEIDLKNLLHIHGENDRIFPIQNIKNVFKIKGGHFMIVNKADEISSIINSNLISS